MYKKIDYFMFVHSKAFFLLVLICLMVIITSTVSIIGRFNVLSQYDQIITSAEQQGAVINKQTNTDLNNDYDPFNDNGNNKEPNENSDYINSDEYKATQDEINKAAGRYASLSDHLTLDLYKKTNEFFISYDKYSQSPSKANLDNLKKYITDSCYKKHFENKKVEEKNLFLQDVLYSDVEKDTIKAMSFFKGSDEKYILDFVMNEADEWLIDDLTLVDD